MNPERIWYKNPSILLTNISDIFPIGYDKNKPIEDVLNSVMRLLILSLLGIFILSRDMFVRALLVVIVLAIFMVVYYENIGEGFNVYSPVSHPGRILDKQKNMLETFKGEMKEGFGPEYAPNYNLMTAPPRSLQDNIMNDIKNHYKVNENPNTDYKYYNRQLDYDNAKHDSYKNGSLFYNKRNIDPTYIDYNITKIKNL
jgi:hypothetical protein